MSVLAAGLLMAFMLYAFFLAVCIAIVLFLPASFLGTPAKTVLTWLPPFLRGEALRNWAAMTVERLAKQRLASKRNGEMADKLAAEVEAGAMQAMLPTAGSSERDRIIACPENGQGMVGVTAPEALTIAAYLRKNRSRAEQQQIYKLAVENVRRMAIRTRSDGTAAPLPCPLQGEGHVCCVYGARPLRCRPLHAISIAKDLGHYNVPSAVSPAEKPSEDGHEHTVAQGIEIGLTRALKSAGLDANIYELNNALATALEKPDAAERWAKGETVFHTPLSSSIG